MEHKDVYDLDRIPFYYSVSANVDVIKKRTESYHCILADNFLSALI